MSSQTQLRERSALLIELRQIVQAMKNMAFAELQRVSHELPAQALACETVLDVLWPLLHDEKARDALSAPPSTRARSVWLVIGAERGFCSGFNAHLAAALVELKRDHPQALLLVASRRLVELLGNAVADITVLPGCAGIEDADAALDAWLVEAQRQVQPGAELWLMHAASDGLLRRRLLPTPDAISPTSSSTGAAPAPQTYLPRPVLRDALLRQATGLLLRTGLYASLAMENHWRLTQMQRAQDHLDDLSRELRRRYAVQRQSEITNELETLMSSMDGTGQELRQ